MRALFDIILEANKHKNLIRLGYLIFQEHIQSSRFVFVITKCICKHFNRKKVKYVCNQNITIRQLYIRLDNIRQLIAWDCRNSYDQMNWWEVLKFNKQKIKYKQESQRG